LGSRPIVREPLHQVGFDTAAIELILPTYGQSLGLKGKMAKHWALNPHPTLIPAIESGWVESIHSFGGESGMEDYTARPEIFFTGRDGSLRSNRVLCQLAEGLKRIGARVEGAGATRILLSQNMICGWLLGPD
jgi:hypothetical protein